MASSDMNKTPDSARKSLSESPIDPIRSQSGAIDFGNVDFTELRTRFSLFATVGVQYSIIATPLTIGTYMVFILGVGGSPFFFGTYIVCFFFQMMLCISMAELASSFPHSLGQIFWATILAPPKWARYLGYWTGAFTTMQWVFVTATQYVLTGSIITATASVISNGKYNAEVWHVFLVGAGIAFLGAGGNIWFLDTLPIVNKCMVMVINATGLFLFITLWVRSSPKQTAESVFLNIVNETGLESLGIVFLLGLLPGSACIGGFDAATHLTEEVPQPEKNIPRVMVGTALMCGISGLITLFALLFCTVSPENLLAPIGGQPIAQLVWDAFDSYPLTVTFMVILAVLFSIGTLAVVLTSSRVLWAFSRQGGLPFSKTISAVNSKSQAPTNAVLAVTLVGLAVSLLELGPSFVLNSVLGSSVVCVFFSYGLPIWLLLYQGRDALPTNRSFNLGKWGIWINIITVCWQVVSVIFLCFPLSYPVTTRTMNYAAPTVAVGVVIFAANWIIFSKNHYQVPKLLYIEGLHEPSDITRAAAIV